MRHVDVDFVFDHERCGAASNGTLRIAMAVDTLASDGNKETTGFGRTRVDRNRRNGVGQDTDDSRLDQCVEQRPKLSHHGFFFAPAGRETKRGGTLGMTSSCNITVRARSAKIGAATVPP